MSRQPRSFLVLLLLVCSLAVSGEPAVIDNQPLVLVDDHVSALRAADFNGDAKLDFAVLTYDGGARQLVVHPGNGDGTFAAAVRTAMPGGASAFEVALLDDDAIADVVVSSGQTRQLFRGLGTGAFAAGVTLTGPSCEKRPLAVGEMTGDGRTDVIACGLTVFPNLGGGNFGTPFQPASYRYAGGYVVDANADGKRDVVLDYDGQLHLGNGNGTFQSPALVLQTYGTSLSAMADFDGSGRADIAYLDEGLFLRQATQAGTYENRTAHGFADVLTLTTADLNRDGRPDLVGSGHHLVSVWLTGANGLPGARAVYTAGSSATSLVTGDFTGDGAIDVLVAGDLPTDANPSRAVVALLRGSANGTLQAMRAYVVGGQWQDGHGFGGRPSVAAVSDVTSDGKPDLVTVASEIPAIAVFAGRGDGTFADVAQHTNVLPGVSRPAAHLADLNDDGRVDVLLQATSQVQLYAFVANGDGTYRQTTELPSSAIVATGDFNGDGNVDVVHSYVSAVQFRAGRGNGTFDEPVAIVDPQFSWWDVGTGDVNNDGRDDLVFGSKTLLGNAAGTFTMISYGGGGYVTPSGLVDLDGDGKLDLIAYGPRSPYGSTSVKKGNGDGTFGAPRSLTHTVRTAFAAHSVCSGDFNGDGHADASLDATLLLGDGAGFFNGYAHGWDIAPYARCGAADVDGNGSDDLLFVNPESHSIAVIRTRTAEPLALPLSLTIESAQTTAPAAASFGVTVRSSGETQLAPTGAVVFSIGGQVTSMMELVKGTATGFVIGEVLGSHPLEARFSGDDVYNAAVAPSRQVEITRAATSFTTTLLPRSSGLTTADTIRFSGTVTSNLPGVTGTVTLFVDDVARETQPAPAFDFLVGRLAEGRPRLRIEYSGDEAHLPKVGAVRLTITRPEIAMTVAADPPNGAVVGTPITVTVTFPNDPQLSGTVNILNGGVPTAVAIVNGVATLTSSQLSPGDAIGVAFPGDATYRASTKWLDYTITDAPIASGGASSLYLVTPCRILDTRNTPGFPIHSGDTLAVYVSRRCGIPFGAKAVAVNVTIVNPQAEGYVTAYPAASPFPRTATVNYRQRKTRANNALLPLSAGGVLKVFNGGAASIDVVVDVTAYFQ